MKEILDYIIFESGSMILTVRSIVLIFLLLFAIRVVVFVARRFVFAYFRKRGVDNGRITSIYLLVTYVIWVVGLVAALEMTGIHITILIAGSAALLVGLGLGVQQIFQDLASGIFILLEGIIKVDDVIELDGKVGRVLSIKLRTSEIYTQDGKILIVPNHKFITESITNWSLSSERTRFKVSVGVAYGSDLEKVKRILLDCAGANAAVLTGDEDEVVKPFVRFIEFGDSSLNFELFFWTANIFQAEFIKSDLRFLIDKKFRENNVMIPFPQRDVHLINHK